MSEKDLFLRGIKPALLVMYKSVKDRVITDTVLELLHEYPYILFRHKNEILFFQDELQRDWFLANGIICHRNTVRSPWIVDYKKDVLGLTLGYPPMAVDFFMEKDTKSKEQYKEWLAMKVELNYHGMRFIAKRGTEKDCLEWLRRVRPVREEEVCR